jgi:hypothetical protein
MPAARGSLACPLAAGALAPHAKIDVIVLLSIGGRSAWWDSTARKRVDLAFGPRKIGYKRDQGAASFVWLNLRGAAVRFVKPSFSFFLPPSKRAKPCRQEISTIGTTPSCCRSHLPLHHILLDRGGGVLGVLHVCISRRRRHLRHWIRSEREEETASTTTSSMFCWTFLLYDFFKGMKISFISLVDYIS